TVRDGLAAQMTRERTSRPYSSVPKAYVSLGGFRRAAMFCASGGWGLIHGARMKARTFSETRMRPASAARSDQNRRRRGRAFWGGEDVPPEWATRCDASMENLRDVISCSECGDPGCRRAGRWSG